MAGHLRDPIRNDVPSLEPIRNNRSYREPIRNSRSSLELPGLRPPLSSSQNPSGALRS